MHTHHSKKTYVTYLPGEHAVLIYLSDFFTAELVGGVGSGRAVNWHIWVAPVVLVVPDSCVALEHGVVLGGPLQGWLALAMPIGATTRGAMPGKCPLVTLATRSLMACDGKFPLIPFTMGL